MPLLSMRALTTISRRFIRRTDGQDLIEYSLLIGIITVGVVLSVQEASGIVAGMYSSLLDILDDTI